MGGPMVPGGGNNGVAATGYGSGGGGATQVGSASGGGAGGGYLEKLFLTPSATYSYGVGAAGTAGTNAAAGQAGIIIVDEYYY